MVLKSLTFYLGLDQEKKKAGRPPKVSDLQLCALFILSYITNTPVFTLAKSLIDPNVKSYHLLFGKKVKLMVDGTIPEVANLNRART
jgi:hypothetical protein